MGTASEWLEQNHHLIGELKAARKNQQQKRVERILEALGPTPTGSNIEGPDGLLDILFDRILEVIDPKTGKWDNPHGPAVIEGDGTRKWYRFGLLHNASGPAIIEPDGTLSFFYFGRECDSAQQLDEMVYKAEEHEGRSTDWRDHMRKTQNTNLE